MKFKWKNNRQTGPAVITTHKRHRNYSSAQTMAERGHVLGNEVQENACFQLTLQLWRLSSGARYQSKMFVIPLTKLPGQLKGHRDHSPEQTTGFVVRKPCQDFICRKQILVIF